MNFPSQVKTRTVVFLLACMLFVSSVSIYYGLSASTPTSGLTDIYIEPPMMESSYIIGFYTDPTTCYLKNGTTGQITTTGTFTVCLTAAKNALTTGGKILIRSGSYNLTAPVTISTNGVYIEGEDQQSTIIRIDWVGGGGLFYFSGSPNWRYLGGLKKLWMIGNNAASSTAAYIGTNCSDITIEDCIITNFDYGLQISAFGITSQTKVWNIWIHRCLIEDNLRYGIFLANTTDGTLRMIDRVKVSECHFYNNLNSIFADTNYIWHITFTDNTIQAERGACINVSGGRQWIITDNQIFDCGIGANGTLAGIFVNGTGTFYPDSWLIENNIIANHFTSAPVAMNNSIWLTGTVTNFVIQGNFFFQASEPVRFDGLTSTCYSSLKIENNKQYNGNPVYPAERNSPYTYILGASGSLYYMLNCSTNTVDFQSTNGSNVVQSAVNNTAAKVGGGTICFTSQIFNLTKQLTIPAGASDIRFVGEGKMSTILAFNYTPASIGLYAIDFLGTSYTYADPWGVGLGDFSYCTNVQFEDLQIQCQNINLSGVDLQWVDRQYWRNVWVRSVGTRLTAPATTIGIRTGCDTVANNGAQLYFVEASGFYQGMYLIDDHIIAEQPRVADCNYGFVISCGRGSTINHPEAYLCLTYPFNIGFTDSLTLIAPQVELNYNAPGAYDFIWFSNAANAKQVVIISPNLINVANAQPANLFENWETVPDLRIEGVIRKTINGVETTMFFDRSSSTASCVNNTAIAHGLLGTPTSITLSLQGPTSYNATIILMVPTILSINATHFNVEFTMWKTVGWTQVPVTAVEAQTIYWSATCEH